MSENRIVEFDQLEESDLFIDAIYQSGPTTTLDSEVLHKLFPKCENSGGFRKVYCKNQRQKLAYVVLYTSLEELEWPDFLDVETGVFRYYGDNRKPGHELNDTKKQGNRLLERVFNQLHSGCLEEIPPFLIFKKTGQRRDVQFLGLAVPGNPNISSDRDLVAFWRSMHDLRFQNYEAYFTVLDTSDETIAKRWLRDRYENDGNDRYAPKAWKRFKQIGLQGIKALKAQNVVEIPSQHDQLQSDSEGLLCLDAIRSFYQDNPTGFEACSVDLMYKIDPHFKDFQLTRPWRDGGRDAIGYYEITPSPISKNSSLKVECALEAKCYAANHGVGVHQLSRLISRIRYRQFGILCTTSFLTPQAYQEVVEDGHPIMIVTATDIAFTLKNRNISHNDVPAWLREISRRNADSASI